MKNEFVVELDRVRGRAAALAAERESADLSVRSLRQARPGLVAKAAVNGGADDDALAAADDQLRQAIAASRAAGEQASEAGSRVVELELQYARAVVEEQIAGLPAFEIRVADSLADLGDALMGVTVGGLKPSADGVIRDFHLQGGPSLSAAVEQAVLGLVRRILGDPAGRPSFDSTAVRAALHQMLVEIDRREMRRAERLMRERAQRNLDATELTRVTGV